MTDTQLYLAAALPALAMITSLIASSAQISGIRDDVREIRSDIKLLTGKVYELMAKLTMPEKLWA